MPATPSNPPPGPSGPPKAPVDPRAPRQQRSRRTRAALLAAVERLLAQRLFEEVSVAEIAREAGVSVGAFYARFRNKEALMPELQDRYVERLERLSPVLFAPERWHARPLERRTGLLARLAVRFYRRNRGLLRALTLDWRVHGRGGFSESNRAQREAFHARIASALVGDASDVRHPEPEAAARFAVLFVGALLRDALVLSRPDHPHPLSLDSTRLVRELERTLRGYLVLDP